jgi:hypothetical protein
MTRLVARRISDGVASGESPREMALGVLAMIGQRPVADVGETTEVVADLNSVAALAPAVASIVDAAERKAQLETLHQVAGELRHQAVLQFDEGGSGDVRGAALWDAASHLNPDDGDALGVGRRKGELAPGGVVGGPPSPEVPISLSDEECVLDRGGRCQRNDQRHVESTHGGQR